MGGGGPVAGQLWAEASEYASPVLGLIFLRYADERFAQVGAVVGPGSDRRPIGPEDYKATGALYLPDKSRFETLLNLPGAADIGKALNQAMGGIEDYNPDLKVSSRRTTPASPMTSSESSYGSCGHYRKRSRVTGSG